jgi:hypothetical protein
MFIYILQMKLQGDKSGRKGHLSVATEVLIHSNMILCNVRNFMYVRQQMFMENNGIIHS